MPSTESLTPTQRFVLYLVALALLVALAIFRLVDGASVFTVIVNLLPAPALGLAASKVPRGTTGQ